MIDPNTLSPDQTYCPGNCPFLGARHFLPEILPFYCNKFDQFLGVDTSHRTARCAACRGQMENIVQTGLSLIESYTVPQISIPDTKQAFLGLNKVFQSLFVEVVKKTGRQVGLVMGEQATPEVLTSRLLQEYQEAKDWQGSPEVIDFKGTMGTLAESAPGLLTRETQTLLMNLFGVLDKSERAMLKGVLSSPKQAEAFLEEFKNMPKDMSLLKNFRHKLYEYDDREKQRVQQRSNIKTQSMNMKLLQQNELNKKREEERQITQEVKLQMMRGTQERGSR